jgi:repressor of nif and glnA expression
MEDKQFEEKMEEDIHVEEDEVAPGNGEERHWTEDFVVSGEELVDRVKELVREANVRRIIVKNEEKRVLFEIPLVAGVAGIALLPGYAALALIAALAAECTITVERVERESGSTE